MLLQIVKSAQCVSFGWTEEDLGFPLDVDQCFRAQKVQMSWNELICSSGR